MEKSEVWNIGSLIMPLKSLILCTCISDINTVCMLKYVTGFSKRAGDHPGTVDRASKHPHLLQVPEKNMYSLPVRSARILKHILYALIKEEQKHPELQIL